MKTLVDTNVLLDVITRDPTWSAWSENALREAAERTALAINPIVFAEVSMKFDRIEDADAALVDFAREPLPYEAGFLAGKAFLAYKRAAVQSARRCRTSTLAPTRSSGACICSHVTAPVTGRTSLRSRLSSPSRISPLAFGRSVRPRNVAIKDP